MAQRTEILDLGRIGLTSGEGRHLDLTVPMDGLQLAGQSYAAVPSAVPVKLDVSRMNGGGYTLRLRYEVKLGGPCMRCLESAGMAFRIDSREIDQPGGGSDDLDSPYVDGDELDLQAWARDALALELPSQIVCSEDCKGICSV